MATPTITELLDLEVGQRQATFKFELVNAAGNLLGEVHPDLDHTPSIENNVNRTIKRAMRNVRIFPTEYDDVNPLSDRVRPSMVFPDGTAYPLGVFVFADAPREIRSFGRTFTSSFVDLTIALDQAVSKSVGYSPGYSIVTALTEQFTAAGFPSSAFTIDASTAAFGAPVVWPAGTRRFAIMADMAGMMGAFSPYFDNSGLGRVKQVVNLATAPIDHTYDAGTSSRIVDGTIVESDDLLSAPNQYIVIDSAAADAPIVGSYDVPDTAPNSILNRGFVVSTVIDEQGLQSVAAANAKAAAAAAQDASTFTWVSFKSAVDPRHDTFEIVLFLGERYREQQWNMDLVDNANMSHDLRRVYS